MTLTIQLLFILSSACALLLVPFGLPGTWLVLLFAGLAEWVAEPTLFTTGNWMVAAACAVLGELWEFGASSVRASRAGAGRLGSLAALAGGILGAVLGTVLLPIPIVGTVVGGSLGAFAASAGVERGGGRSMEDALRIGRAAAAGHAIGLAGKLFLGALAWLVLCIAIFT